MIIQHAETDEQIAATYEVMRQLRPHLVREDYVPAVRALMASEGFRLAALIDEGAVRAVAGYRVMTMLYGGRLLYMDDLVADETVRSRGYGRAAAGLAEGRGAAARKTNVRILSERFVQPSGGRAPSLRAAQGGGVTLGGVAA